MSDGNDRVLEGGVDERGSNDEDQGQVGDQDDGAGEVARAQAALDERLGALRGPEGGAGQREDAEACREGMARFCEQYGVDMQIPAFYVQAAKIFPQDPPYCVQVVNYVLPS